MGSGTAEHFSKWREGLVGGRLTIDLKKAGLGDSPLSKSSFRWKSGGGEGLAPSPPPAQPSLTF